MRPLCLLLLPLTLGLAACGDKDDGATDGDGGTDADGTDTDGADTDTDGTDTDADTDTDSDTDADTDTDGTEVIDADGDGFPESVDCDDTDDEIYPGATERCDGIDNDCDDRVDDDDPDVTGTTLVYLDDDGDGWGDDSTERAACDWTADEVEDGGDCDDGDEDVNPGEEEVCDEVDNDCDGDIDDADDDVEGLSTWFRDRDGDGYGDDDDTTEACDLGSAWSLDGGDCDDGDYDINPGADEVCDDDDVDEDCDGRSDDDDSSVTGEPTWYRDSDGDGYGTDAATRVACDPGDGWALESDDCDDDDPDVVADRTWYRDLDGDGWGDDDVTDTGCVAPDDHVALGGDCNDLNAYKHPGAVEECDGEDNDCDELIDDEDDDVDAEGTGSEYCFDDDGDGHYADLVSVWACETPADAVLCSSASLDDCDDTDDAVSPSADEVCGNGVDDDCDGTGNDCEWNGELSLDDADVLFAPDHGSYTGWAVYYSADDLDGDGAADLLIGAPYADPDGAVYSVSGPWSGRVDLGDDADEWDAVGSSTTTSKSVFFGSGVAAADLGGDGDMQILVGDQRWGDSYHGAVAVMDAGDLPPSTAVWLYATTASDYCGSLLRSPGDMTGDGDPDVLIGCTGSSTVYGLTGEPTSSTSLSSAAGFTLEGGAYGYFGWTMNGGDVDGDGIADFLGMERIGLSDDTYATYVEGPLSGTIDLDTDYDDRKLGEWYFGDIRLVGDVDLDGYDDVGYSDDDGVYVGPGGVDGAPLSSTRLSYWRVDEPGEFIGGDFNGDGEVDLALEWDGYVAFRYGPLDEGSFTTYDGAIVEDGGGGLGQAMDVADIDGDGYDDMIIGGYGVTAETWTWGGVWIYYGKGR